MRYVALVAIGGLAAAAMLVPSAEPPSPGESPASLAPDHTVCAVEEGAGRTTQLTAVSASEGSVQLTLFASGRPAGSIGVSIGAEGASVIPIVDVAAVGTVGGLVELPPPESSVGSVVRGPSSLSMESCSPAAASSTMLTGGSTADQRSFEVHLMNPYAGEAVVDLRVTSEVGVESDDRLRSVIVPAFSSVIVDMATLLPGRTRLSVGIDSSAGRVFAVGRQAGGSDSAVWNAATGATDWLIPVPTLTSSGLLRIGNASGQEVDFQVDVYGSAGLVEAVIADVIDASGEALIDLATLVEGSTVQGLRVISTSPVVATLWFEDQASLGVTGGVVEPASRWLLAGSAIPDIESQRVVILNPGLEDASVTIHSLRPARTERSVVVPAQTVIELALETADGFLMDSTSPVVGLLVLSGQGPVAISTGSPFADG
jgi:hypothetical protein